MGDYALRLIRPTPRGWDVFSRTVIASEAKQSGFLSVEKWIASLRSQ
jgi:hypothetical protein